MPPFLNVGPREEEAGQRMGLGKSPDRCAAAPREEAVPPRCQRHPREEERGAVFLATWAGIKCDDIREEERCRRQFQQAQGGGEGRLF